MDEKLNAPLRILVLFIIVYAYHTYVTLFLSGLIAFLVVIVLSFLTWLLFVRLMFQPVDQ